MLNQSGGAGGTSGSSVTALSKTKSGNDGNGGNAGAVDVSNSGVIVTTVDAAGDIVALAQGANAGAVTINNTDDVVTTGAQSAGLSAQSLGKTSAAGMTVANSGSVMTNGAGSNALTARSVVEEEMLLASRMAPQTAQSFASHEASFFLFDFVTAVGDQAGNVSVDHNGTLRAAGDGSSAIYAQGTGSTNGNIDIVVHADSLLVGGAVGGASVTMIDGAQNSLANHGTITVLGDMIGYIPDADGALFDAGWIDGMAMQGTTGDIAISNTGLIVGNISIGSGTSTFTNTSDGWMVAGSQIGLGGQAGSLFANAGVLSSGGVKIVKTTVIDGSFDQTETGKYLVDLDFAGGVADNLQRAVAALSASG